MADITMCPGTNCPHKEKCYRFTAKPCEYWQAYFTEPPIKDGKCEYYWGENAEFMMYEIDGTVNLILE